MELLTWRRRECCSCSGRLSQPFPSGTFVSCPALPCKVDAGTPVLLRARAKALPAVAGRSEDRGCSLFQEA